MNIEGSISGIARQPLSSSRSAAPAKHADSRRQFALLDCGCYDAMEVPPRRGATSVAPFAKALRNVRRGIFNTIFSETFEAQDACVT